MIELVKPDGKYLKSYLKACKDFKQNKVINMDSFDDPDDFENWKDTIFKRYDDESKGINLEEGYVPSSTFWLVENDEYIGTGNIRHFLNENLEKFGGHIGYFIRCDKWGKGYGTIQLKLLLKEAKSIGINKALITCNEENIPSARVIEKNGGKYLDTIENVIDGKKRMTKRYFINIE